MHDESVFFSGNGVTVTDKRVVLGQVHYLFAHIEDVEMVCLGPVNNRNVGWLMLASAPLLIAFGCLSHQPLSFGAGGGMLAGSWLILQQKSRFQVRLKLDEQLKQFRAEVESEDKSQMESMFDAVKRGLAVKN